MKKIAYLILVHNDSCHIERLINSINYNCDFYIHIDSKTNLNEFENLGKYENVYLCNDRMNICWGGFNMVIAMKNLMRMVLNSNEIYSHMIFLSGADYPIKSKEYIYEYFNRNEGKELIKAFYIEDSNCEHCYDKIQRYRFFDKSLKYKTLDKITKKILTYMLYPFRKDIYVDKNKKIKPAFGSQWFAITPECASYILEYGDKNKFIDKYFKTSFAPDEMYFHTIIFNSEFINSTTNGREENYTNSKAYNLNNFHLFDTDIFICDSNVSTLKEEFLTDINKLMKEKPEYKGSIPYYTEKDFYEIMESDCLFIRKVNTKYSTKLLNKIDKSIKNNL